MSKEETTYSFSRLDWSCLYAWHLNYNLGQEGEENGWGIGGELLHDICESVAKGEITEKEALQQYKDTWFEAVEGTFPSFANINLSTHYYWKILPFFERDKFWKGGVTAVEEHIVCNLPNGKKFQMYIDLQLNDRDLVVDHKIAKRERFVKELEKKRRQVDLYAYGIKQKHGKYPKKLIFNFFQEPYNPIVLDFDEDAMNNSLDWAMKRIDIIEKLGLATTKLDAVGLYMPDFDALSEKNGKRNMFCKSVCSYRSTCRFTQGDYFINKDILEKIE